MEHAEELFTPEKMRWQGSMLGVKDGIGLGGGLDACLRFGERLGCVDLFMHQQSKSNYSASVQWQA